MLYVVLLCFSSCTHSISERSTDAFSQKSFQDLIGDEYPIAFVKELNDIGVKYGIEYIFEKSDPYQHYIVEIQFSSIGSMFNDVDYTAAYNDSLSINNPDQHRMYFPLVGSRAQYSFLGAGPGGSSEQLVFTTTNKSYDIKIIFSHLLPSGVEMPMITIEDFAVFIDQVLTNQLRNHHD